MIELSLKTDFGWIERALQRVASDQIPFAASRAINDCTRAARDAINRRAGETFDRPTPFTQRAVVAPRELAATKQRLVGTVTVRPVQAKYLLHEEIGGTRQPGEGTRKPGAAIVLPGRGLLLDQYGNIPAGTLRRLKQEATPARKGRRGRKAVAASAAPEGKVVFLARGVAANKAGIGGYFRRLAGHKLTRLTIWEAQTHYAPRMHYREHVRAVAVATWPAAFRARLAEAIATAR